MGRKRIERSDFDDIQDENVPMGGFAPNPMPSQEEIDRAAEALPQMTPEEVAAQGVPRIRRANSQSPKVQAYRGRTMKQIVDEFIAEISNHPDCNVMTSAIGGRPPKGGQFKDSPLTNQHMVELRFAYRDPIKFAVNQEERIDPFAPGGKYYDLIPKRGDAEAEVEQVPQDNVGQNTWDHLIKKRETQQV